MPLRPPVGGPAGRSPNPPSRTSDGLAGLRLDELGCPDQFGGDGPSVGSRERPAFLWHAHGMDTDAFKQWWASLDEGRKAEARALSAGENVPGWMVASLARAGRPVVGTYWPGVQAGPDGFPLPDDVHDAMRAAD